MKHIPSLPTLGTVKCKDINRLNTGGVDYTYKHYSTVTKTIENI